MVMLCLQPKIIGAHAVAASCLDYHRYEKDVLRIAAVSLVEYRKYDKDVHLIKGEDISIANDGDSELVGSLLDKAPVSCSLVPLLHGAAMNGDCCCSCILQRCGHLQNTKCAHDPLLCLQNRPFNRPRPVAGLLQPLAIPELRWQSVSVDFITQLPETAAGHTAIVVITCDT